MKIFMVYLKFKFNWPSLFCLATLKTGRSSDLRWAARACRSPEEAPSPAWVYQGGFPGGGMV